MSRAGRGALLALLCALAGCANDPTQIVIEVRSDLSVPDELDRVVVRMVSPDGREQTAEALLGPGQLPLPRILGVLHEGGPLEGYETTVTGLRASNERVVRRGVLSFQAQRIRLWSVTLERACEGVSCVDGETCAAGACRPATVGADELLPWDNRSVPEDGGVQCVDELCNERDDDCDGTIDEGFDLTSDDANCGACGVDCTRLPNATGTCVASSCQVSACAAGFDDCNAEPGCETEINANPAACGGCGNACSPPNRECCAGVCARSCP